MLSKLEMMFRAAREDLMDAGPEMKEPVGRNKKGQATRGFDRLAERAAAQECARVMNQPVVILSEEAGEIKVGEGEPTYTLVLDPVDGSRNFMRGIEFCGFAVAAIPHPAPKSIDNTEFALVGNIFSDSIYAAEKGKGARFNGRPLTASNITKVKDAIISVDVGSPSEERMRRIERLLRRCKGVRCLGSAALEICLVASGGVDAYIDLKDSLTAENFLASGMILREAGGVITDPWNRSIPPAEDLSQPFNVVASGNRELHEEIISLIEM